MVIFGLLREHFRYLWGVPIAMFALFAQSYQICDAALALVLEFQLESGFNNIRMCLCQTHEECIEEFRVEYLSMNLPERGVADGLAGRIPKCTVQYEALGFTMTGYKLKASARNTSQCVSACIRAYSEIFIRVMNISKPIYRQSVWALSKQ